MGDGAGILDMVLDRGKGDGEPGAAAPARFLVLVDRASEGKPDGDRTMPVVVLFITGEAIAEIDEEVADLGIGDRGRGLDTGSAMNLSSSREALSDFGGDVDVCTGERGADMEEGGVGTPRNCCSRSRRIEISLFASTGQL
jgi:hypothetical protein